MHTAVQGVAHACSLYLFTSMSDYIIIGKKRQGLLRGGVMVEGDMTIHKVADRPTHVQGVKYKLCGISLCEILPEQGSFWYVPLNERNLCSFFFLQQSSFFMNYLVFFGRKRCTANSGKIYQRVKWLCTIF